MHSDSNTAVEKVSNTTTHVALLNFKGQKHRANTCIVGATLVVALAARVRGMVKTAVALGASFVTRTGIT